MTWLAIVRLGLVQASLGAFVVLTTATMNRVMVVELALPAVLPGLLVALYYGIQYLRPRFGHGADRGGRRTPWIAGGVAVLATGTMLAALSLGVMERALLPGIAVAVGAFVLIGLGIGAAGTNLLALLAARTAPSRQAAAGSLVWIMMICGLAATGITAGQLLDPYSHARLLAVTAGVAAVAGLASAIGLIGQERGAVPAAAARESFSGAARALLADPQVRLFTLFVFASMLAYNLQDLILEPFAGHVFGMTVGESTALGGQLHAGALLGTVTVFLATGVLRRLVEIPVRAIITGGCLVSGLALAGIAYGGTRAPDWPIAQNVLILGVANGAFAVAAIGAMMRLASADPAGGTGIRMGLFGAAQAFAFGLGSFLGTAAVDAMRLLTPSLPAAYGTVFAVEAAIFAAAAVLSLRATPARPAPDPALVPGE